jgi:hypothetical protein
MNSIDNNLSKFCNLVVGAKAYIRIKKFTGLVIEGALPLLGYEKEYVQKAKQLFHINEEFSNVTRLAEGVGLIKVNFLPGVPFTEGINYRTNIPGQWKCVQAGLDVVTISSGLVILPLISLTIFLAERELISLQQSMLSCLKNWKTRFTYIGGSLGIIQNAHITLHTKKKDPGLTTIRFISDLASFHFQGLAPMQQFGLKFTSASINLYDSWKKSKETMV